MSQRLMGTWCAILIGLAGPVAVAEWEPGEGPLMTRWAEDVSPDSVHPEYPRPQMVREDWRNLNGLWDYAIRPRNGGRPEEFDGRILVPFAVESALSGVMERVGDEQRLWYRRTFELSEGWADGRLLLHFGAVDWEATVWVNGQEVGAHRGGYDPFTLDITAALVDGDEQEIVVAVWDPADAGFQARGKQVQEPHGIWYTPVTGIWQTVWLEPVPEASIDRLKIVTDIDEGVVRLDVAGRAADGREVRAAALEDGREVADASGSLGETLELSIDDAKLWSPDSPFLYDLRVELVDGGEVIDRVDSYFGMRKIAVEEDEDGVLRLFLNNEPLFQYGPLDQGYWPDGLYTAPTDEALRYDIEVTRDLGFNMARKHVKVEPARWYYWADKLGLLVWQDMPNGDEHIGRDDPDVDRVAQSARQFEIELKAMIDAFGNHPSIVMWVPFNEGWGQYDTARITDWVKAYDPTRLVNSASGWTDRGTGDVLDIHAYPGPAAPEPQEGRASVLGEFGGLGLPLSGHTWQDEENWGYRSYETREELNEAYLDLLQNLRPLIHSPGLAAAIYTQTTDVEIEVNGIMTYEREVIKFDAERMREAHRKLFRPPPDVRRLVPTSQERGVEWRYTTQEPPAGWQEPGFDDSTWDEGPAGFGTDFTRGSVVRTTWDTDRIWVRRTFELPADAELHDPHLLIHHDEDVRVYINGERVAEYRGYTVDYVLRRLGDNAAEVLRPGETNTIAVRCSMTGGGQYIDVGIVDVVERGDE